jgi:hypothetical protein
LSHFSSQINAPNQACLTQKRNFTCSAAWLVSVGSAAIGHAPESMCSSVSGIGAL